MYDFRLFRILFQLMQSIQTWLLRFMSDEYEGSCFVQVLSSLLAVFIMFIIIPALIGLFIWIIVHLDHFFVSQSNCNFY